MICLSSSILYLLAVSGDNFEAAFDDHREPQKCHIRRIRSDAKRSKADRLATYNRNNQRRIKAMRHEV